MPRLDPGTLIAIGTLALLVLEMALIRAYLVRGHLAWRATLVSGSG